MIDPARFILFLGAAWALILAPGPDMLYVITRAMTHGRRAGMISAAGVVCGILIHTTAAALGLTLILQTSAPAFLAVKTVGAVYLVYLGIRAWRDHDALRLEPTASASGAGSLFWQGVLSNVLNPKIAVFFLAFLPQFVDAERGPAALQMAVLGTTFAVFGLCFLLVVGYFSGSLGRWLTDRPNSARLLQRLAGGILVGLGIRLAFAEN